VTAKSFFPAGMMFLVRLPEAPGGHVMRSLIELYLLVPLTHLHVTVVPVLAHTTFLTPLNLSTWVVMEVMVEAGEDFPLLATAVT